MKTSQTFILILAITFALSISACGGGSSSTETIDESPGADDLLQGDPFALAVEAIPAYSPIPPSEDDFVVAAAPGLVKGLKVHRSRIVVKLNSAATTDEVNSLLKSVGAAVAGKAIDGVIFVDLLNNPSQEELVAAIATFEASPTVDLAVADALVETDAGGEIASLYMTGNCEEKVSQPNPTEWTGTSLAGQGDRVWQQFLDTPGPDSIGKTRPHGNWWLEYVRMPAVWNFNDAIDRDALAESAPPVGVVDEGFQQHIDIPLSNYGQIRNKCHGNMVAGIIAASHRTDSIQGIGINGTNPYASITDSNISTQIDEQLKVRAEEIGIDLDDAGATTLVSIISSIHTMLNDNSLIKVINLSYGIKAQAELRAGNYFSDEDPDVKSYFNKISQLAWEVINDRDVLLVAAAGNNSNLVSNIDQVTGAELSHGAINAKWSGPFHYLALEGFTNVWGELVKPDNVLIVESVGWQQNGGRRNADSSVGGDIAAPGACITSTSIGNGYGTDSGTSFAAPIISGLASYLSMLDPGLTAVELKNIILQSAVPKGVVTEIDVNEDGCSSKLDTSIVGEPDQPPIVDAYAAVMRIDGAVRKLVDADDGTVDGATVTGEGEATRLPGDGKISMADFRAFRDAVLQTQGVILAEPYHIKRDNNRDGCVWDGVKCNVPEKIWSRFDFNGDGILHETLQAKLRLPGDSPLLENIPARTDLDILSEVWPPVDDNWDNSCANQEHPETEGWCANDLSGLIKSRDVIVDFAAFEPQWGETIKVRINIGGFKRNRVYRYGDEPVMAFTVPHNDECTATDPVDSNCQAFKVSVTSNGTSIVKSGGVYQDGQGASAEFYNQPFGHDELFVLKPQVTLTLSPFAGKSFETEMTATAVYTFDDLAFLYDPGADARRDDIRVSCAVSSCANILERTYQTAGMLYRFIPIVTGELNLVFQIRNLCEAPPEECPPGSPVPNLVIPFTVVAGTPPEPEPVPEPEPEPEPLPPIDPPPMPPLKEWTAVGQFSWEAEFICNEATRTISYSRRGTEPGYQTKENPDEVQTVDESRERTYDNPLYCAIYIDNDSFLSPENFWVPGRTFYRNDRGSVGSSAYAASHATRHIGEEQGSRTVHIKSKVVGHYADCEGREDKESGCYPYVWHSGYRSDGEPYGYYTFHLPGGDVIYPPFPPFPTF